VTSILPQVMLYIEGEVPVTLTLYSIQSPFFTPTEKSAKTTANDTVTISKVKAIISNANLRMLSQIECCITPLKSYQRDCKRVCNGFLVRLGLRVIRLCSVQFPEGSVMTTEASLDKVYAEVKRVRVKLESIEKTLESLKESMIPEEKVSPEEMKELKALKREALRGECVPLEEVLKKHEAKKRA
jgi:hypothetical protein